MEVIGNALPDDGGDGTEAGRGGSELRQGTGPGGHRAAPGRRGAEPDAEGPAGAPGRTPGDNPDAAELDLDDGDSHPRLGPAPLARLAAAFSGESLAIAGLTVAVAAAVGGYFNPVVVVIATLSVGDAGPRNQVEEFATGMLISGTVAMALSVAGLFRLPQSGPAWARALAGAGLLVAVLCLLVAAVALWKSASLPTAYAPGL